MDACQDLVERFESGQLAEEILLGMTQQVRAQCTASDTCVSLVHCANNKCGRGEERRTLLYSWSLGLSN